MMENKTKIDLKNKSIFITGVAGFIGSNLAKRLLSTVEGVKVVGLDNMNNYYDVRLKEARLKELEQFEKFNFVKGNLADKAVIEGDAKGYYSDADEEICIQVGMGESQTIKTMIHEVAHAMLHNSDLMKQRGEEKDRLTKETEAESIAFTVCSALGIDTSDYSFPYVASWASGKEMKELKDSIDTIRLTAADFLEKLEAAVAERSAERMTAMQYAEKLIANKEQEKTIFDDEQRNLIVNFAFKLDDRAATEELVNGIAAAVAEDDKEEVNRLMYDAQEKIENLPDGMIGLSEMHDYGYRKDDVLPLTKEGAREWHRLGEKIYPLFRDGTAGDYVSQEGIEQHDGIFGIKADAWDSKSENLVSVMSLQSQRQERPHFTMWTKKHW